MPDSPPESPTRGSASPDPQTAYRLGKRYAETAGKLKSAEARIADLEKRLADGPKAEESAKWRSEALASRHRDVFDRVRKESGVRPDLPTPRLMGLLNYAADSETPDEKAIADSLAKLKQSDAWLFADPTAAEKTKAPTEAQKLLNDPFASRGAAGSGSPASFVARRSDLSDPIWCVENQSRIAEAVASKTFKIVD